MGCWSVSALLIEADLPAGVRTMVPHWRPGPMWGAGRGAGRVSAIVGMGALGGSLCE